MSTGYKIEEQDGIYYLTFQIVRWIDLFTRPVYRDIVIDSLRFCQSNEGLAIYAYVIMSNHIHLLVQSEKVPLSNTIREFKSFTARKLLDTIDMEAESRRDWILNLFEFAAKQHKRNEKYQVWTHENHAELIYSEKFMEQKINYIHQNPVRAGIVSKAEDYIYSSASAYTGDKELLEIEAIYVLLSRLPCMRTVK